MYAYHSLGQASVHKATVADDKAIMRTELENAVAYFEKSTQEAHFFNPDNFCRLFYRTYLAITFQGAKEDEVQRYLAEAKEAVGNSKSKDELFKAVENLARASQEAQRLKDRSIQEVANELNVYRWYCEKAAEYMAAAEDKAPGAVKLMRRCNPLLEDRIQATIAGIQENAKLICEKLSNKGEDAKNFCRQLNKEAKSLSEEGYKFYRALLDMNRQMELMCQFLPEDIQSQAHQMLNEAKSTSELLDKLAELNHILIIVNSCLPRMKTDAVISDQLKFIEQNVNSIHRDISKPVNDKLTFKVPLIIFDYQIEVNSPWIKYPVLIIVVGFICYIFLNLNSFLIH